MESNNHEALPLPSDHQTGSAASDYTQLSEMSAAMNANVGEMFSSPHRDIAFPDSDYIPGFCPTLL